MAHHEDPDQMIEWSKRTGKVAVGWGEVGRLTRFATRQDLINAFNRAYPTSTSSNMAVPSLLNFRDMAIGDLAIISRGSAGRSHVVEIVGDYEWARKERSVGDYRHQRTVVVTEHDADDLWLRVGRTVVVGQDMRWTVARCK